MMVPASASGLFFAAPIAQAAVSGHNVKEM